MPSGAMRCGSHRGWSCESFRFKASHADAETTALYPSIAPMGPQSMEAKDGIWAKGVLATDWSRKKSQGGWTASSIVPETNKRASPANLLSGSEHRQTLYLAGFGELFAFSLGERLVNEGPAVLME